METENLGPIWRITLYIMERNCLRCACVCTYMHDVNREQRGWGEKLREKITAENTEQAVHWEQRGSASFKIENWKTFLQSQVIWSHQVSLY